MYERGVSVGLQMKIKLSDKCSSMNKYQNGLRETKQLVFYQKEYLPYKLFYVNVPSTYHSVILNNPFSSFGQ